MRRFMVWCEDDEDGAEMVNGLTHKDAAEWAASLVFHEDGLSCQFTCVEDLPGAGAVVFDVRCVLAIEAEEVTG